MAWTFPDDFKTGAEANITDFRGARITFNGIGGNYGNSAAFDLFPDTAEVGNFLQIGLSRKHWGIRFSIGTAFAASSVEFIWEYATGNPLAPTWVELNVENKDAFTKTGVQVVRFTPPEDWIYQLEHGHTVRCRIVSLTSITEGGRTDALVSWNTKPILGTGTTNMTLVAAETADLAGEYILLTSQTPASSLTPLEMPVNLFKATSKLDVILAGATLGAGDSITLTGVDQTGGALVEVIDVSGGNATYTTSNVFRNITDVACTGFSDGTIEVKQKRWGVITQRGLKDFSLRANLLIGDGSTTTTMTITNTNLTFAYGFFHQANGSTLTFGSTTTVGEETYGINGCTIFESITENSWGVGMSWHRALGTCTLTYNGTRFNMPYFANQNGGFFIGNPSATVTLRDCTIRGAGQLYFSTSVLMVRNKFLGSAWFQIGASSGLAAGSKGNESTSEISIELNSALTTLILEETTFNSLRLWIYSGILKIINSPITTSQIFLGYGTTHTDAIKIIYTLGMGISNTEGSAIEGATVVIRDVEDTPILNTTTNASGEITETELIQTAGTSLTANGPFTWKDYTPHNIKVGGYNYVSFDYSKSASAKGTDSVVLLDDNFITEANQATALAYTGIGVNHANQTVTVSSNHSVNELYDYLKALNFSSESERLYDQVMTTVDGNNFTLNYNLVIDGVALTGSGNINLGSNILTLPNGGTTTLSLTGGTLQLPTAGTFSPVLGNGSTVDFTGAGTFNLGSADITGTINLDTSTNSTVTVQLASGVSYNNLDEVNITVEEAPLTVTLTVSGIIAGSRIQIYDTDSSTELYNEIVAGTTWTDNVTYTSDTNVRIRLMYVDGASTAYRWWTATSTITSFGFSVNASQEANSTYTTNNIDGSTVTECSVSGTTIRIYVDSPSNTITAQRIYNWYQYFLFTEAGIRDQDGAYITATDSTHYTFADTMKIINQDTVNPLTITGANIVPTTGAATNVFDLTNGASIALNFNRVEGFAYSSGSGLSPEQSNKLDAINSNTAAIPDDVWDEPLSSHQVAGSTGKKLSDMSESERIKYIEGGEIPIY